MSGPNPRPRPNAMPLLNVRFSCSVQNRWMVAVLQVRDGPPLRELVEHDHEARDAERDRERHAIAPRVEIDVISP